ncbi:MAG: phosphatase PAP2 family protein [Ilumatobacteraceae bacterium]
MSVTVAVLLAAAVAAVGVWALSRAPGAADPVDPEAEERWLVRLLIRHPRFGATFRLIDRKAIGGLMLLIALTLVFVTALVVGVVFDMVDQDSGLARWDSAVAEWGSRNGAGWPRTALEAITDLGGTRYLLVIFIAVAIQDYFRHRNATVPYFLATVLGGVVLINNGLKWLVDRPRPAVAHLVDASGSSFPSGHSAAAAAAWFALALIVGRRWSARRRCWRGRRRRGHRRRRRRVASAARSSLADRRHRRRDGGMGLVPAQRSRVRRATATLRGPRRARRGWLEPGRQHDVSTVAHLGFASVRIGRAVEMVRSRNGTFLSRVSSSAGRMV